MDASDSWTSVWGTLITLYALPPGCQWLDCALGRAQVLDSHSKQPVKVVVPATPKSDCSQRLTRLNRDMEPGHPSAPPFFLLCHSS